MGRRRELNEDSLYWSDSFGLLLLADGMGGRDFGEVASSLCISTLNTMFKRYLPTTLEGQRLVDSAGLEDSLTQLLDTWVRDMNGVIHGFGADDQKYQEMGTTLVLLYQREDYVVVAHVGDSRIYRVRDGEIRQLTEDHSFVNSQLKAGLITPEEAAMSSHKNIITRAIGTRPTVKCDVAVHPCRVGDLYLLCSDGLSDQVHNSEILATMEDEDFDLERSTDALIDLANARGGPDNITVILSRVVAAEE